MVTGYSHHQNKKTHLIQEIRKDSSKATQKEKKVDLLALERNPSTQKARGFIYGSNIWTYPESTNQAMYLVAIETEHFQKDVQKPCAPKFHEKLQKQTTKANDLL